MSHAGLHRNQSAGKSSGQEQPSDRQSQNSLDVKNIWQTPQVNVFKHFRVLPNADWKLNKRQGDVTEIYAQEIGSKALLLNGNISANNFVQIPHPEAGIRAPLGLTGRYLYLQAKAPVSSSPLSFHFDLIMAERPQQIRISASNLYKSMSTQNGFSIQVPLNLDMNRFTVVVFDIVEILKQSQLLPVDYMILGAYQIKTIMICACSVVRGVFTSDNLYDFVTLPPEMRFKFSFPIDRWPEQFAWIELPADILPNATEADLATQRRHQAGAKAALVAQARSTLLSDEQKLQMEMEISEMLDAKRREYEAGRKVESKPISNQAKRLQDLQDSLNIKPTSGDEFQSSDEKMGFHHNANGNGASAANSHFDQSMENKTGQRKAAASEKLNLDPIMELEHVIGYSPQKCKNLKWSRLKGENVILFSAGGTLIAMDTETNIQKRFFFGHTSPICCFDLANHGEFVVSAEEQTPVIRIWEYKTARCISTVTVPSVDERGKKIPKAGLERWTCLAFSPDGFHFASVGKDAKGKEIIVVWDISNICKGGKPEILAKHTSEFNIIDLKFSPEDNTRMISCGRENIRFWEIKQHQNIRGSAVVLEHHSRNTVFTALDFGWTRPEGQWRDPDILDKVFVSSKSGVVFQVNYETMKLEQAYQTTGKDANDKPIPINAIASNWEFCATGSDNNYLKVWSMDFGSFFMDMTFEGAVSALEVSPDGLRIACGTQHGSLGILHKTALKFKMMIRSQTEAIVAMDFHKNLNLIITVSSDMTIRLFDLNTYEQTIEFLSRVDEPLCIAAHPYLNIFSCGFKSGNMCILDIDKTRVIDQMNQHRKPMKKVAYSPCGSLLVACFEDGSISLHNALRQHLPFKMMELQFPPKHIHVAFSPLMGFSERTRSLDSPGSYTDENIDQTNTNLQDDGEQPEIDSDEQQTQNDDTQLYQASQRHKMFAVMGEHGNNLRIYDADTIILKHQIQAGHILRSFEFNKIGSEIIMITEDLRIKFCKLNCFEGECFKELSTVHRDSINCSDLSLNGGYMLTGGQDTLIKVWDYDAQKNIPSQYQAFIGHTFPITDVKFNPWNNDQIVSIAERDGIYLWQFHGDTHSDYFPGGESAERTHELTHKERRQMHLPTMLERMRASVKDKKTPKLPEGSFRVLPFEEAKPIPVDVYNPELVNSLGHSQPPASELYAYYQQEMKNKNLTCNQFVSVNDAPEENTFFIKKFWREDDEPRKPLFVCQPELDEAKRPGMLAKDNDGDIIDAKTVHGYDGFGGVHDNLIWNAEKGNIIYSLNNKVIREVTKTREQKIIFESAVRISCLAQFDYKYLAVAEGEQGPDGFSNINIYYQPDDKSFKQTHTYQIQYHRNGVQAMLMTKELLISVDAGPEPYIVISKYFENLVVKSFQIENTVNEMFLHPFITPQSEVIEFFTFGNNGSVVQWHYEDNVNDSEPLYQLVYDLSAVPHLQDTDFTCATAIPEYKEKKGNNNNVMMTAQDDDALKKPFKILIGTKDGHVVMLDKDSEDMPWVENGRKVKVKLLSDDQDSQVGQINHLVYKKANNSLVLTDSVGNIVRYTSRATFGLEDFEFCEFAQMKAESSITAIHMEENNVEGIIGTESGNIWYVQIPAPGLQPNSPTEQQLIRLVTRATSSLEMVQQITFDKHSKSAAAKETVFLSLCGPESSEVKLYVKDSFDQVMNFPGTGLSPVAFVCGTSRQLNGKIRLVGCLNGEVRLIQLEQLREHPAYKIQLAVEEQLSCGVFNDSGFNFAIGTNRGCVYLGEIKYENKHRLYISKLDGLPNSIDRGVTSLQLSNFTPDGNLIVAFDDGVIKVWQSGTQKKENARTTGGRGRERDSKVQSAIQPEAQFNRTDMVDLYQIQRMEIKKDENQDTKIEITYEDRPDAAQWRNQRYHCEVVLALGNHQVDKYFCFTTTMRHVFLRNYYTHQSLMTIGLDSFPTSISLADYQLIRSVLAGPGKPVSNEEFMIAVGGEDGKAVVYKLSQNNKSLEADSGTIQKVICRTRGGMHYGACTRVALTSEGNTLITASQSGELLKFDLKDSLNKHAGQ